MPQKLIKPRMCIVCNRLFGYESDKSAGHFMDILDLTPMQEWRHCSGGNGHTLNRISEYDT